LAALTEELERASTPENASTVVGHILSASAARSIEAVAFFANAGDDVRPAGLLRNVAPLAATAGGGLAAIAGDLANMAAAMATALIDPEDMVIVASPPEAVKLRLLSGPRFDNEILGSMALPAKSIAAFARGSVASSFEGTPSIETSKGATLHYNDPASPLLATPASGLFQQAQIALRLRQRGT
jgi:hypothetical protein